MIRLLRSPVVRIGFLAVAVTLAVVALVREWSEVSAALSRLSVAAWLASVPLVLAGLGASMLSWRAVLADLGSPLPVPTAARVYFVGQLGKYVPGSVWPVLAQMEMASDHGVPRRRSAAAFGVSVLLALCTGLLAGCATLPLFPADDIGPARWLGLLAPVFLALLHPAVLNRLLRLLSRLGGGAVATGSLTGRGCLRAGGWVCLAWVCFGAQVAAVALSLGADEPWRAVVLGIGGYTLAWSLGFLVVVAPAGAGVREVALVAALSPLLDRGEAIVAALVSRLLLTAGDLAVAGVAVLGYRSRRAALERAQE
jgi:uncharacterized membrane protein YbhN (UPF0104 family)